jgi:hypothetical protein
MRRELGTIYTGDLNDCRAAFVGARVHACKHPCHMAKCGQLVDGSPGYLAHAEGDEMWLNMIDPDEPLFRVDLFRQFLQWALPRVGRPMLIHCNQGESRARSLALLILAATGKIDARSYEAASRAFANATGKAYRPGRGIGDFLDAKWDAILDGLRQGAAGAGPDPDNAGNPHPELSGGTNGAPRPLTGWAKVAIDPPAPARAEAVTTEERDETRGKHGYTDEEIDTIADDPELWATMHAKISDRVTQEPIDFHPSILQRRMFAHYRYCQERQLPCRECAVKIRRGGGSTGAEGIMYVHAHNYVARLGSVGTTETVSMNMFKMIRFFDRNDTFPWKRANKILETGHMHWPNGSTWEKYTADNPEAARSAGLQGYHATEVGRWPDGGAKDAKETLKSMLGAVPRRGFTVVIEESTAQGSVGAFADRFARGRWPTAAEIGCPEGQEWWRKWADETPQNIAATTAERDLQFVRIAAAWFEDGENRADVEADDEERIMSTLDAKEIELIRRYQEEGPVGPRLGSYAHARTVEQLAWRRAVIESEFEGDVEGFEQENPSSPKEAFASSGRHTFNRAGCAWMLETAKVRPPTLGVLVRQPGGDVVFQRTDAAHAWVRRYEEPREGMAYIEGVDTCGGKSNQRTQVPDYNAACVLRRKYRDETGRVFPRRLVMELTPKNLFDPDVLAERTQLMSDYYGTCLVVFEVNNTGAAYRQEAKRLGMNLYREEVTDKATSEVTEYIGWTTTQESREELFGTMKKVMRNNARAETRADGLECWSIETCQEVQDCIRADDGKDQAPSGKHDDRLLAIMFAIQNETASTRYAAHKRRRREPPDRGAGGWQKVAT